MQAFDLLAPVLQEFIYSQGWDELRGIQEKAIVSILTTDDNLLLAAGTASGKTEAAFLPVVTHIIKNPPDSAAVLYISPLKALINDQYKRVSKMLEGAKIRVTPWHGDAPESGKRRVIKSPAGVIQTTPESLENLITHKPIDAARVFANLRFIILDEVHAFMGSPRGVQLLSLLERLARLTGNNARRIGLSATVGDTDAAKVWLASGTGRGTYMPEAGDKARRVRVSMQRYEQPVSEDEEGEPEDPSGLDALPDALLNDLYKLTLGRKSLLFARSRGRVEQVIACLKSMAKECGSPDIYRVHHGSISKGLREDTEYRMKSTDEPIVTGATLTLELGIDIGALDQVVHLGSPLSASSLTQRLGRCGRKGQPSYLSFLTWERVSESRLHANAPPSVFDFDWQLLRSIAITNLTLSKWVEPPRPPTLPYAILAHQTIAHVLQNQQVTPAALARFMLTLTPFRHITQDDFRILLRSLLEKRVLDRTEDGGLILGIGADKLASAYTFSSVFEEAEAFSVMNNGQLIGTVTENYKTGMLIALAGMVWKCVRVNAAAKEIIVEPAEGVGNARWSGGSGPDTHDMVQQRMKHELECEFENNELYPYLGPGAARRFEKMRADARKLRITKGEIIPVGGNAYAWFPWVGTRKLRALRLILAEYGVSVRFMPNEFDNAFVLVYYNESRDELVRLIRSVVGRQADGGADDDDNIDETDRNRITLFEEHQVEMKYNDLVPMELLHKQYKADALDMDFSNVCLSRDMKDMDAPHNSFSEDDYVY